MDQDNQDIIYLKDVKAKINFDNEKIISIFSKMLFIILIILILSFWIMLN